MQRDTTMVQLNGFRISAMEGDSKMG